MSSLTHFSSSETLWYHPYPYPSIIMDSSTNHNHQQQEDNSTTTTTKQPMFEKPLTPSDVGKLNRLVIPKQHAEKYFPLSTAGDSLDQQKGLLLSFEDETGKPWRFRYSYWNSSQSYVLTKGWSRFVKEKRLDAGDVVLFERHSFDCHRLFIGWRRRPAAVQPLLDSVPVVQLTPAGGGGGGQINGWGGFYDAHYNYPSHHHHLPLSLPHPYQPDCLHAGAGGINDNVEKKQRDMVAASGNPRRVRLFGVNLECPDESEPSTPDGSSQQGLGQLAGQPHYQYHNNLNLNLNQDMNINFSQMRYQQHQG